MGIEGVIRPPPEIRAVADKTASYVAKNGRAFEARILGSGKGKTPKFAFLQPTSPFHAYYEERIRFYENGGEDKKEDEGKEKADEKKEDNTKANEETKEPESAKGKDEPTKKKKVAEQKGQKSGAAIDPIAKALLQQRGKIAQARAAFEESVKNEPQPTTNQEDGTVEEPRKRHYTPPAPPPLELVNIVAPSSLTVAQVETIQLVAQFTALDGKGGPFIGRLTHREWSNPAFAFCQPRHGHFAYFSALVDAYRRIYDTWTSSTASSGDMVEDMATSVDKCLELTAYRVEYERDLEEQTRKQKSENGDDLQLAQIDWHDFVVVETIDFPKDEKVELGMLPPPPPPRPERSTNAAPAAGTAEEMDESDDEEGETIRVVPTYKPKVVAANAASNIEEVIDPITGKSVPVKDMPEHMRIQLLDPKWAEERKKFQEKQKDSNLVSGDTIASNISRFSRDAYGRSGPDLLQGETDSKKRLEEANRIIHDQSQRGVGPSLPPPVNHAGVPPPPPPPPPAPVQPMMQDRRPGIEDEPAAKRARLDGATQGVPPTPSSQADTSQQAQESSDPMLGGPMPSFETPKDELIPAEEFAKTLSKPEVTLQVRIPNDPSQMAWNFYGQIVSISVDVMSKVKAVKQELSKRHLNGMPANKIQLKSATGFLKDSASLAALNIGPTATVDMIPKTRGGRK